MDYLKPIMAGVLIVFVVACMIFGAWTFERWVNYKYSLVPYQQKIDERVNKLNNRLIGVENENANLKTDLKKLQDYLGYD